MKIKATSKFIFTYNSTLDDVYFNEEIELKWILSTFNFSLGKFTNEKKEDEIKIKYLPSTINKLRYLYQIKRLGAGLEFETIAYAKVGIFKHIWISIFNRFLPFISNSETLFKMLTLILTIVTIFIGQSQLKISKSIQKIEIVNKK